MSLFHKTDVYQGPNGTADRKRRDNSFVLALLCVALTLAVASVVFTPAGIGSGINGETSLVGP